jgi:hypothetical protein
MVGATPRGACWKAVMAFLLVASLRALSLEASQAIYSKDNAPQTPRLDDLPMKGDASQHGITWTFDKPVPVGRFVNGDYYVVGPVTVVSITPAPVWGEDARDGSVLNQPPNAGYSGFDSRSAGAMMSACVPRCRSPWSLAIL